jgi:hypothetical protein
VKASNIRELLISTVTVGSGWVRVGKGGQRVNPMSVLGSLRRVGLEQTPISNLTIVGSAPIPP